MIASNPENGFAWADAAVGAGLTLALVAVLSTITLVLRRRSASPARAA